MGKLENNLIRRFKVGNINMIVNFSGRVETEEIVIEVRLFEYFIRL